MNITFPFSGIFRAKVLVSDILRAFKYSVSKNHYFKKIKTVIKQ